MTDKGFLFKGVFYRSSCALFCLLSNNKDIHYNELICPQAKPGISYVRGWLRDSEFECSTRRLTQDELRDLNHGRLDINKMDARLLKAKVIK